MSRAQIFEMEKVAGWWWGVMPLQADSAWLADNERVYVPCADPWVDGRTGGRVGGGMLLWFESTWKQKKVTETKTQK